MAIVLSEGMRRVFEPFDREAQFRESEAQVLAELLDDFDEAGGVPFRARGVGAGRRASGFGVCEKLRQLLAASVAQVSLVMEKWLQVDLGPWVVYFADDAVIWSETGNLGRA